MWSDANGHGCLGWHRFPVVPLSLSRLVSGQKLVCGSRFSTPHQNRFHLPGANPVTDTTPSVYYGKLGSSFRLFTNVKTGHGAVPSGRGEEVVITLVNLLCQLGLRPSLVGVVVESCSRRAPRGMLFYFLRPG